MENKELSILKKIPQLKSELAKVIIGQHEAIDQVIISLMAGGHCLLEGVPGLAKTLMVKTLADTLSMDFNRIQFTPDLMPSDIIGVEMIDESSPNTIKFKFLKGPIFANIILADEINRTPPKTQAALLEAMQEFSVSYAGKNYEMPKPFFIVATQNPIEQAGTYPLPEAQLDRFLLYIKLAYPSETEELQVLNNTSALKAPHINQILNAEEIIELQDLVKQVHIDEQLLENINKMVRNSRPESTKIEIVKQYCDWGAGPRAGQALLLCAKARALLKGRYSVIPEDIKAMAAPVMRHRIKLNFKAISAGINTDNVVEKL